MFIDIAKISVKAGKGGDGAIAWRREKFEPAGGPFGGDGGNGGDIILETDEGIRTLMDFRYQRHYKGENGENGATKRKFGRAGEPTILKVPVGTLVKDSETEGVIIDLKEPNQRYIIAKGGRGGRGNARFATSTRQAPNFAEPGTKGEEKEIILELKLLADVGLIGYPNVGKSTLLSTISAAKPKIANYHFTTLKPNLGVVKVDQGKSFVIADIPGLIEGAHEGVGLGHDFLKHIERTRVLVHVLDISGFEGRDPIEDFENINKELFKYNEKLKEKPQIVVANKMDLPNSQENLLKLQDYFKNEDIKVLPISAATKNGLKELIYVIWDVVSKVDIDYETFDEEYIEEKIEYRPITVERVDDIISIQGDFIDDLILKTNFDSIDSLRHFQKVLTDQGVIDKVNELGVIEGETILVGEYEFEYFK